jgi:hypothetical protein
MYFLDYRKFSVISGIREVEDQEALQEDTTMDRAKKLLEIKTNLIEMRSTLSRCIDGATEHKEELSDEDIDAFHMASENMVIATRQLETGIKDARTKFNGEKVA